MTIKLGAIEGAEVRDATGWMKRILGPDINKMKIGRTGLLFTFINSTHTIAGKAFVPASGELWKSEKEVGFNCERLHKAFSIFRRKDKTELYLKEGDINKLFLKNGALKWRYNTEGIEEAQKVHFKDIPTPSTKLNVANLKRVRSVNKGKRASEKMKTLAFKYGKGKAEIYAFDKYDKERVDLGEVEAEGLGEGIACYNLEYMEKILKDAKAGVMRIEEGKPAKFNIRTGKKTKALIFLAPVMPSDELRAEIKGVDHSSSSPPTSPAPKEEEEKKEEGVINVGTRVFYTGDMANIEGWGAISKIINDDFGLRYNVNLDDGRTCPGLYPAMFEKSVGQRFKLEAQVVKERLDMIQEQEKREQERHKEGEAV